MYMEILSRQSSSTRKIIPSVSFYFSDWNSFGNEFFVWCTAELSHLKFDLSQKTLEKFSFHVNTQKYVARKKTASTLPAFFLSLAFPCFD